MEFLRQLFHGKGYIDGITIINLDGEILFSAKLNSKFSNRKEREAYQALVGQNFFDVFENLNAKNSSMIRAMEVGLPVYVENQLLQTKGQEGIHISSLSIPIKSGRAVVGAIDLSMEEMTDGEEEPESVELTSEQIPVGGAGVDPTRRTGTQHEAERAYSALRGVECGGSAESRWKCGDELDFQPSRTDHGRGTPSS